MRKYLFTLLLILITPLVAAEGNESCHCKIKVGGNIVTVGQHQFSDINECRRKLKGVFSVWDNICGINEAKLSCGKDTVSLAGIVKCSQRTPYHALLSYKADAKLYKKKSAFGYHKSDQFNLRRTFSDIAVFLERNPGLSLSNSLHGGIYDQSSENRVDLTIIDFYEQVQRLLKKKKYKKLSSVLNHIVAGDPIKNFPKLFRQLDVQLSNSKKFASQMKTIVPTIYNQNAVAVFEKLSVISRARFANTKYKKNIDRYNSVALNMNRNLLMKEFKKLFFKKLRTPITVQTLAEISEDDFEKTYIAVNGREHIKRVKKFNEADNSYKYGFQMNGETGHTLLISVSRTSSTQTSIGLSAVEVFNYLHTRIFTKRARTDVTPLVVQQNLQYWEDFIQEHSWSTHIGAGDDMILLIFRDWMKNNRQDIIQKLKKVELTNELQGSLSKWTSKKPKRALTLDLYSFIKDLYPSRPWESHFIINENGEKIIMGEERLQRSIRNTFSRLKSVFGIENVASSLAGSGVMALTSNPYASAAATTLIHDFITASRYGYDVGSYVKKNTPQNLASSLIFSTGFAKGRMADAVFRGASNGALQSLVTGSDIKLGMIVGGLSGGLYQKLPPEVSNWIVSGEDKNTLNIFSELSEQAFFKGMNGAVVAYYEDGDWKKGLKKGAMYGAGSAALKIAIFGVRYDANAYISDEEIDEYNHLHNHEEGYFHGEHLDRSTSVMSDRYGEDINITRDDVRRAQFRKDGYLIGNRADSGVLATNYSSPLGSEISIGPDALMREETLLHEVMHTRQTQNGRLLRLFDGITYDRLPEGFWEEYVDVGMATLPKGYYRTFIYVDLFDDL